MTTSNLVNDNDVVKSGQLKTGKKMTKTFVVVRQDGYNSPARIDCYSNRKHFLGGSRPRSSLRLSNLFSVNKTTCSEKNLHEIAVFGPCRTLYLKCRTIIERNSWFDCILRVHNDARTLLRNDMERRKFDYVWDVKVLRKGLTLQMARLSSCAYRLCLDKHTIYLYKHCQQDEECLEFPLCEVNFSLTSQKELIIETGCAAVIGQGEIWLKNNSVSSTLYIHQILMRALVEDRKTRSEAPISFEIISSSPAPVVDLVVQKVPISHSDDFGHFATAEDDDILPVYATVGGAETISETDNYTSMALAESDQSDSSDKLVTYPCCMEEVQCSYVKLRSFEPTGQSETSMATSDESEIKANKNGSVINRNHVEATPSSGSDNRGSYGASVTPSTLCTLFSKLANASLDLRRRAYSLGSWRKKIVQRYSDNRSGASRISFNSEPCRPRSVSFGASMDSRDENAALTTTTSVPPRKYSVVQKASDGDFVEIDFGASRPISGATGVTAATPPSVPGVRRYVERSLQGSDHNRKDSYANFFDSEYTLMECPSRPRKNSMEVQGYSGSHHAQNGHDRVVDFRANLAHEKSRQDTNFYSLRAPRIVLFEPSRRTISACDRRRTNDRNSTANYAVDPATTGGGGGVDEIGADSLPVNKSRPISTPPPSISTPPPSSIDRFPTPRRPSPYRNNKRSRNNYGSWLRCRRIFDHSPPTFLTAK